MCACICAQVGVIYMVSPSDPLLVTRDYWAELLNWQHTSLLCITESSRKEQNASYLRTC